MLVTLLGACAENRLHTYIMAEATVKSGDRAKGIELSIAPLKLVMTAPDADDLETLAEDLKLTAPSKFHRLPPLTLLRFDMENQTALPWRLKLNQVFFREIGGRGRTFRVVTPDAYAKYFTSVAYEHFRYEEMYSSYVTHRAGETPKTDFWFEKRAPADTLELKQGEAGFQILPFEFMGAGVERLVLQYPIDEKKIKEINVALVTERGK